MSKAVATIMRLALVTGQRVEELAGMRREEVDLSPTGSIWTQSGSRRKNKELTRVPLSLLAVSLIKDAIRDAGDSPHVFPSPTGNGAITAHAATRALGNAGEFSVSRLN